MAQRDLGAEASESGERISVDGDDRVAESVMVRDGVAPCDDRPRTGTNSVGSVKDTLVEEELSSALAIGDEVGEADDEVVAVMTDDDGDDEAAGGEF